MSIQAHIDNNGNPIPESAICSFCEGNAGLRIKSYVIAKNNLGYDGGSRETVDGLSCVFCGEDD